MLHFTLGSEYDLHYKESPPQGWSEHLQKVTRELELVTLATRATLDLRKVHGDIVGGE